MRRQAPGAAGDGSRGGVLSSLRMDAQAIETRVTAFAGCLSPDARAWLQTALEPVRDGVSVAKIRLAIARAGRQAGDAPVDVTGAVGDAAGGDRWRACDAARAAIVLKAAGVLGAEAWSQFVTDAVRRGELSEQVSLLRMLPWLPACPAARRGGGGRVPHQLRARLYRDRL